MTMHLIKGVTALNTRKPKFKLTKAKEAAWRNDHAEYNRELKRQGQPKQTWEQYVDNRLGRVKLPKQEFKPLSASYLKSAPTAPNIPSLNANVGNTYKKETLMYDGERKLLGIAVLHKSCLQPVFSQKDAEEIAKMRRG